MARPHQRTRRRAIAGAAAGALALAGLPALLGSTPANASSHREAPFILGEPQSDNTDVYAYVSPDKPDTVTLTANWIPFEEPNGGPNFYPWGTDTHYDINIDNNGDALPDITYRWVFHNTKTPNGTFLYNNGPVTSLDDPNLLFQQTYDLQQINYVNGTPSAPVTLTTAIAAPSDVGPPSMPDYATLRQQSIKTVGTGATALTTFAGQADDPFFLDLRVFDLLYGGNLSEVGHDTLNGYNVNTIALQVPKSALALAADASANPVIGVWSTTERPQTRVLGTSSNGDFTESQSGDYTQVSRLGNPLVNEVVIPYQDKNKFNASSPSGDGQFLNYVQDPEVPHLIKAIYGIDVPDSDPNTAGVQRADLVQVFLTGVDKLNTPTLNKGVTSVKPGEELRLNMSIPPSASPNRLGVLGGDLAGFPNGRRLTDDVVDIELQALEGALLSNPNALGDGVSNNDLPFGATFPYVALPHDNSVNAGQFGTFKRLAGTDRYATAAAIATAGFPAADTVVLANGTDAAFPDALAASYIAGNVNGPILLTTLDGVPGATTSALASLKTKNIVIVGGTARVSAAQEAELKKTYAVRRIAGNNRYETSRDVAEAPGAAYVGNKTAIVATGEKFPDALVSGPIAYKAKYPIILTEPGMLSGPAAEALSTLGINKVIIAGGTGAVSDATAKAIAAKNITVTRVAGLDRTSTAVALAQYAVGNLGFVPTSVDLARGDLAADALTGGPFGGRFGVPTLLTADPNSLSDATTAYLQQQAYALLTGQVFGGTGAISEQTLTAANAAASLNK